MSYNGLIGGIVTIPDSGNPVVKTNGMTFYNGEDESGLVGERRFMTSYSGFIKLRNPNNVTIQSWFKMDRITESNKAKGIANTFSNSITKRFRNVTTGTSSLTANFEGSGTIETHYVKRNILGSLSNIGTDGTKLINKVADAITESGTINNTDRSIVVPTHRTDILALKVKDGVLTTYTVANNVIVENDEEIDGTLIDINTKATITDNWEINGTSINIDAEQRPLQMLGGVINNNRLPVVKVVKV